MTTSFMSRFVLLYLHCTMPLARVCAPAALERASERVLLPVPHPTDRLGPPGPRGRRRRGRCCNCSARTRRRHNQINVTRLAKLCIREGAALSRRSWEREVPLRAEYRRVERAQMRSLSSFGPPNLPAQVLFLRVHPIDFPFYCQTITFVLPSLFPSASSSALTVSLSPLAHLGEIRPHQCVIRCETRDANGDMLSSYIGRGSSDTATVDGREREAVMQRHRSR